VELRASVPARHPPRQGEHEREGDDREDRADVPMTPDAAPASAGSTVATMNCAFGAMKRPLPMPASSSGTRSIQLFRSAAAVLSSTSHSQIRPTLTSAVPITSTVRPRRFVRRLLCEEPTMLPMANGIETSPDSSAELPRPDCHRIEMVKKMLVKAAK
jgi:hypothetical protein